MLNLNLGCSDQLIEGFIGVDKWLPPWATDANFVAADLDLGWPWADNSVDHIRAHDIIEHLKSKIWTLNEIHRVLKPGGTVEIVVPTTDGPGAWQDPTHCSYWNRNSFLYHTAGDPHYNRFHEAYGIKGAFNVRSSNLTTDSYGVTKLTIVLAAVKAPLPVSEAEALRTADEMLNHRSAAPATKERGKFAFSILHTSARPDKWREIYDAWIGAAVHPEQVEYVLCVDERWGFPNRNQTEALYPGNIVRPTPFGLRAQDKVIWNTGRKCYVDGVNLAAEASTGDVLIVNADDQWPCEGWDGRLRDVIERDNLSGRSPNTPGDFVIEVNTNTPTEHERGILVMPILSRERYERFGWVFYPEYSGMFADNDFCAMARRDGVVIDARHLVFPHKHWINKQREADGVDAYHNRPEEYEKGLAIFKVRQQLNFAGAIPTAPAAMPTVSGTTSTGKRRIVATCTPGETFSGPWKNSWDWLFANLVNKYDVIPINGYTSDVTMTRMVFAKAVIEAEPQPEFVLWLDDDNMLTFDQFEMLMADLDAHPELDAVVGWCWIMRHDIGLTEAGASISCGQLSDVELTPSGIELQKGQTHDVKFCRPHSFDYAKLMQGDDDLKSIGYSGFPVVLMRAELLKKAGGPDAFLPMLDSRYGFGKSGEDITFFARAGVIGGGKFAVDRRVEVPHLKLMPAGPSQQVLDKYKQEAVAVK